MSNSDSLPLILIGGGGHASVLADILLRQGRKILAVISPNDISNRPIFSGIERFNSDTDIRSFNPEDIKLVNGIGMLPRSRLKQQVTESYIALGYKFETIISGHAVVSDYAVIKEGAQIFPGAIVQAGVLIDKHSIINTGAVIEHDCSIGKYNHIGPRATLCGQVKTERGVYVGVGASVIQSLILSEDSIVAAGATVIDSVDRKHIVYPSKTITRVTKGLS